MALKPPNSIGATKGLNPTAVMGAISSKATHGLLNTVAQLGNLPKIGRYVHTGVVGGREFLVALMVLVVCIAIIVLIYVLVRVVHVRGFAIGHSENVDAFMTGFHNDIDTTRKLFQALDASRAYFAVGQTNLLDMLHCRESMAYFESHTDAELQTSFDTYFKYYDIMQSPIDQWFHSNDIDTFAQGSQTGQEYLQQLIAGIDGIRSELKASVSTPQYFDAVHTTVFLCSSLTADQYGSGDVPNVPDAVAMNLAKGVVETCRNNKVSHETFNEMLQQMIDLCIGVQLMNLYLNVYFETIKGLQNSRRFSFFNFLIVLVKPYVNDLIFDRIVEPAKALFESNHITNEYNKFTAAWQELGNMIVDFPRTIANFGENFTIEKQDKDKPDVVEGMGLGGLFTGILKIGEFFSTILSVAIALANLISDPLNMLFYIVKMILGLTMGMVMLLWWFIFSIPPMSYTAFAIYFLIFDIVLLVVMSGWYVSLFIMFGLISVVLWVLDLMLSAFNGFTAPSIIAQMGRCENLPDIWYARCNFVEDNNYDRAFLCQYPCASRFKPDGLVCSAIDTRQPSYCPQAQAFRIYKGMPAPPNPTFMGDFSPDAKFWTLSQDKRKAEVERYFVKKQAFLTKCSSASEPYDHLVKTVCANWDTVALPNETDRVLLGQVCKQAYCDGEPGEPFCYKFAETTETVQQGEIVQTQDDLLRRIMRIILVVVISIIVILMFLYNS